MEAVNIRLRFGNWVRQEREKQGLSRKQCAKRVEDWLQSLTEEEFQAIGTEDGDKINKPEKIARSYTHWAWSQVERRRDTGDTIHRKTCRQVAVGLNIPFGVVYAQAGFDRPTSHQPEMPVFLDYQSMSLETQERYLHLSREKQRLICSLIDAL